MYLALYLSLLLCELFRLLCSDSCRFYSSPCSCYWKILQSGGILYTQTHTHTHTTHIHTYTCIYKCTYIHTHTYVYYIKEYYFKKFLWSELVKGTSPTFAVLICSFVADWNKCEGRGAVWMRKKLNKAGYIHFKICAYNKEDPYVPLLWVLVMHSSPWVQ